MKKSVYFPGLNGLRFLAAFVVIVHHIEQFKAWFNCPNYFRLPVIYHAGEMGVSLFFVLSGFLITFLLLEENQRTGKINAGRFYARRILRIWPLYFLLTFIVFALLPLLVPHVFWTDAVRRRFIPMMLLYVLGLPNISFLAFPAVLAGAHLWSIGVEEQFYVLWPLLMKKFARHIGALLLSVLVGKFALNIAVSLLATRAISMGLDGGATRVLELVRDACLQFEIEKMTIGGVGAWLLFNRNFKGLRIIYHPAVFLAAVALCLAHAGLLFTVRLNGFVEASAFAVLIMNVCRQSNIFFENKWFDRLGRVSYGLYVWHPLVILFTILALKKSFDGDGYFFNGLLYFASVSGTIAVSLASYAYFESPFLRMKEKFY